MGAIVVVVVLLLVATFIIQSIFGFAFSLLIPAIFWGVTGYFAGRVIRGEGYGLVGNVVLGLVGGIVGTVALSVIGLSGIGDIFLVGNIIVGVIGAVIVISLVRIFSDQDFGA